MGTRLYLRLRVHDWPSLPAVIHLSPSSHFFVNPYTHKCQLHNHGYYLSKYLVYAIRMRGYGSAQYTITGLLAEEYATHHVSQLKQTFPESAAPVVRDKQNTTITYTRCLTYSGLCVAR